MYNQEENLEVQESEEVVNTENEGEEKEDSFISREQVFEEAKKNFPELKEIWDEVEEKDLLFKEVRIRISQPFKKISNFMILKQVAIIFKIGKKRFSPYKLYGQLLYLNGRYYTRIIWMKGNRFLTKQDFKADNKQLTVMTTLLKLFGMQDPIDFAFPF